MKRLKIEIIPISMISNQCDETHLQMLKKSWIKKV